MKIDVNEALIQTASVEIKTLTVRGKQVTLALFRQLIAENLIEDQSLSYIDEDCLVFRGKPWGVVNYHSGCQDTEQLPWTNNFYWSHYSSGPHWSTDNWHLHVVWQLGQELRRATVYAPAPGLGRGRDEYANYKLHINKEEAQLLLKTYSSLWGELNVLPQLFIAV